MTIIMNKLMLPKARGYFQNYSKQCFVRILLPGIHVVCTLNVLNARANDGCINII